MLVLSRREGEAVVIDDDIRIVIGKIKGNKVSVIFDVDIKHKIVREELIDQEQEPNPPEKEE